MNPFKGELGRKGYAFWSFLCLAFLVAWGLSIDLTKQNHRGLYWLGYRVVVAVVFGLVFLLSTLRRVQNTKLNAWWTLLIAVPFAGWLFWLALLFIPSKRRRSS
jgi:uncharacterized membrane protein YhaH (DUF805 family)